MPVDDDDHKRGTNHAGEPVKPARDARGRWLPGHCPNPKGRPRKNPVRYDNQADIRIFADTLVDIKANGRQQRMDRRTALLQKIFESAMKGNVTAQRLLYEEFSKNSQQLAEARLRYDQLALEWIIDNPDLRKHGYELPKAVELEMARLRTMLSYYFPHSYPPYQDDTRGDDDEEGD